MDAAGKMPPENTIAKLWAKNRDLFSGKLRENGIEGVSQFTLLGKTFASGARSYTLSILTPPGKDDDGMERIKSVALLLSSPKLGKKTLFAANYKADLFLAPLG